MKDTAEYSLAARMLRASVLFIAAIMSAAACRSAPVNHALGESLEMTMTHGGRQRTFRLYDSPVNAGRTGPFPLVIALHGGGGDAQSMEKLTAYGFNRLADRDGALVVYPQGIGKHWNCGRIIGGSEAHEEVVDDAGFISSLIDLLIAERKADPESVLIV